MDPPLPASQTKHLPVLHHPIPKDPTTVLQIRQVSSAPAAVSASSEPLSTPALEKTSWASASSRRDGGPGPSTTLRSTGTTGTTLWLSAQVLACYILSNPPRVMHTLSDATTNERIPPPPATATGLAARPPHSKSDPAPPAKEDRKRPRALELGSGVGYLSLALASIGWDVVATDIEPVLSSVLRGNAEDARRVMRSTEGVGEVQVAVLDWGEHPSWLGEGGAGGVGGVGGVGGEGGENHSPPTCSASLPSAYLTSSARSAESHRTPSPDPSPSPVGNAPPSPVPSQPPSLLPPYDLLLTSDTLYEPSLIHPLWQTLRALSLHPSPSRPTLSTDPPPPPLSAPSSPAPPFPIPSAPSPSPQSPTSPSAPPVPGPVIPARPIVLLALERRDSPMIDRSLDIGRGMGFDLNRVSGGRVAKALKEAGWGWEGGDWEGVEVWRGRYKGEQGAWSVKTGMV